MRHKERLIWFVAVLQAFCAGWYLHSRLAGWFIAWVILWSAMFAVALWPERRRKEPDDLREYRELMRSVALQLEKERRQS